MTMQRLVERETGRLLDPEVVGDLGMGLERVALAAGEEHALPPLEAGGELFVYVIDGAGTAQIDGGSHALAPETVVWLEPGDACTLVAGDARLAVLVARAAA